MTYRPLPAAVLLLCLAGAHAEGRRAYPAPPPDFFRLNGAARTVVIAPGDELAVRFFYSPELNKSVKVRQDGKISLDLVQGLDAAGLTPEELQQKLVAIYSKEYKDPEITVDLLAVANSAVYVTGEVALPGAKEFKGRMTVAMALAVGQVIQKSAGTKAVYLVRGLEPGHYAAYKIDASLPHGSGNAIELLPGDVLFVPRKAIVKADDFMEQYVRELLPATPSANTSVIFTPGNANTIATTTSQTP
jgi:protein involved in polysaccharide export with SLBB domain